MDHQRTPFDSQFELLKTELAHIDGAIRQFDEITKSVKNWTIVTWTASLGLALKEPGLRDFVWLTALIPAVFWIVDGSFRRIQRSFILRIGDISKYMNSDAFKRAAQMGNAIEFELLLMRCKPRSFRDTLLGTLLFRTVAFLYAGLSLSSVIVWLWLRARHAS